MAALHSPIGSLNLLRKKYMPKVTLYFGISIWSQNYLIKIVSGTNSSDSRQGKKTARLNIYFGNFQLHYFNSWKLDESLFNQKKNSQYSSSGDSQSQLNFSSNCVNSFFNYISKKFKRNESPESTEFRSNIDDYNSDNDMTEDLMQLFSVVNIKIEKVFLIRQNIFSIF